MISCDFHTHTSFSADSDTPMEDMVKKALSLGLETICFTDHMDYDFPEQYNINFEFDVKEYFKCIDMLSEKYRGQITILKGIELGLQPICSEKCKKLINSFDFDFIIASSHIVNNEDPYYDSFWSNRSESEGYRLYFQSIIDNINSFSDFDAYGHIDYIVRYGPCKNRNYSYTKYAEMIDEILIKLITLNKALEINTAGFKYGLSQPNPQTDVIKRYKELGGELITFGSDAHEPQYISYSFDKAEKIIAAIGFKYYTIYKNRQILQIKL